MTRAPVGLVVEVLVVVEEVEGVEGEVGGECVFLFVVVAQVVGLSS